MIADLLQVLKYFLDLFWFFDGLKRVVVGRSSSEATCRYLAHLALEGAWIEVYYQNKFFTPLLMCLSPAALAHAPVLHSKTKHMKLFFC